MGRQVRSSYVADCVIPNFSLLDCDVGQMVSGLACLSDMAEGQVFTMWLRPLRSQCRGAVSGMWHNCPVEICYNGGNLRGRVMTTTTKMTAKQFLMLGEDPPGLRLELAEGEIVVSPSPSYGHSYTDTQLRSLLNAH